jgi:hypothetical protein
MIERPKEDSQSWSIQQIQFCINRPAGISNLQLCCMKTVEAAIGHSKIKGVIPLLAISETRRH